MRLRASLAAAAALTALVAVVPAHAARSGRLVAFRSCPDLLSYAKANASRFVGAYGVGSPNVVGKVVPGGVARAAAPTANAATAGAAPQEGVDYSGTNVQETGVDEPDLLKTDGNTLFTITGSQLEAVDVSGRTPKLLDTMTLTNGWSSSDLLLSGTHLLVLSRGGYWLQPLPAMSARMIAPISTTSQLTEIDVSDPSNLQVMKTLTLDGSYLDARQIGTTVRVVSSQSLPVEVPWVTPSATTSPAAATARNKAVLRSSGVKAWLPTYHLGKGASRPLVQCRDIRRPPVFSGLGMLTVTTIDLAKNLDPVDSTAVMTDGQIVYASPTNLYVATEAWSARPLPATPQVAPSSASTQIHDFDISDPSKTTYLGSASVPGYLLSQWSLSDFQGVLRVVSTDTPSWWSSDGTNNSQTFLTTFKAGSGSLSQLGQLGGLGQGERVYAVRFIGNDAYVVTFRQVDPLHTLDVSDPAHPKLLGELTLPGYSAYLHPIGDNLLLGIGQDVGANNEPTGTQISLFDVSDLAHPTRIAHYSLGQGWSAAESDHHAFLYWPATGLVMVPFGQQAVGMHVSKSGIDELGRVVQTQANSSSLPEIERSLVVRGDVLTVSAQGVKASDLKTLADVGWAGFPTPPQPTPIPVDGGPVPGAAAGAATGVKKG
jgi:uncharacterized secreted protein with C-terminal beta-propeller domain